MHGTYFFVVFAFLVTFQYSFLTFASAANQNDEIIEPEIEEVKVLEIKNQLTVKIGQIEYQIENPLPEDQDRQLYETMPDKEKKAFHENRKMFISIFTKALGLMKYGFGVGSVVKEKVQFQLEKMKDREIQEQMNMIDSDAKADFFRARDEHQAELDKKRQEAIRLTLKERSNQIVLGFLKSIDRKLWQQAPLFARSNEFGLVATGGLQLLGGKSDKGWGGLIDIGISIGYNRDQKSLVIQIYNDFERYKSTTMPAVFIAGVVGKAGMYIANQRRNSLTHEGISYYPPMMPGFSSMTKDNFMTGFSSGLTWPPSPLGDLLTYTDQLDQSVILRVSVAPLSKKFIRVQTSLGWKTVKVMVSTIQDAIINFGAGNRNQCSAIFN